jgi:hypothetical protein
MLNPADEAALRDLSWHWENAYTFAVVDDTWTAAPADSPADILTAESASELRELVRADYAERHPVARTSSYLQERMSS